MAIKKLLIVYHSKTGNTRKMADAVLAGALREEDVETTFLHAFDAGPEHLLDCDGLLIGTPENFGYMSGAIKDFFDRTYYEVLDHALNLPYAVFVSADNDGTGAVREIDRIMKGYPMRKVCEPLISRKQITEGDIKKSEELGETLACGIVMGIF